MARLSKDEIVTLQVLKEKGESNCAIAERLGVTEGAVRYHLRRAASGVGDGRGKPSLIEKLGLAEVVEHWWQTQTELLPADRSPSVKELWQFLVHEYHYSGSYKSVLKDVRKRFGQAKHRPFRRIETPPGAQTQSDWFEMTVDLGRETGPEKVYGFVMVLSHSRKEVVVWSRSMDQLAWHHVHNEAFRRLGGIAAVNRIDNLKTGVANGAGPWATLNESYRCYARTMGFHIDPHEVRQPQQKGKAERRVGVVKTLNVHGQSFTSLQALQVWTDEQLLADSMNRLCPVTGRTVIETWREEQRLLRPLPALLPEPFDLVRECPVHADCTIRFEGRQYSVPFRYVHNRLEVRGCSGTIQIVDRKTGEIVQHYPRGTDARLLIDPQCYEGLATDQVEAPRPLGKCSRKLLEIAQQSVQHRSIDIYAALAEVAR